LVQFFNFFLFKVKAQKQITICIIKPDIIQKNKKDEVIASIKERGYEIVQQKEMTMSDEQAREFYKHKASSVKKKNSIKTMNRHKIYLF
jgi:nucleoside diphosphate kinase